MQSVQVIQESIQNQIDIINEIPTLLKETGNELVQTTEDIERLTSLLENQQNSTAKVADRVKPLTEQVLNQSKKNKKLEKFNLLLASHCAKQKNKKMI